MGKPTGLSTFRLLLTKHLMLFTLLKIFSCQILNAVVEAKYLSQTRSMNLGMADTNYRFKHLFKISHVRPSFLYFWSFRTTLLFL